MLAMPMLLQSAKLAVEKGQSQGRSEPYIKQLTDYIIPVLVEALHKVILFFFKLNAFLVLHKNEPFLLHLSFSVIFLLNYIYVKYVCVQEPEVEICASMLAALSECIQVCKTYFMKYY